MSTVEPATSPAIEPVGEPLSAVRFEARCVIIPDAVQHSRRPHVVTKSYALPLWRRRPSPSGGSASPPPEDSLSDEGSSHVVLRVPVPTFSFKPRLASRSVDYTPRPPCLVQRQLSGSGVTSPSTPARPARPSLQTSPPVTRTDVVTVPLRPCCVGCEPVTEAALANGDAWPEHFSRAASRRRSMSTGSPRTITVAGSAASLSYGNLGVSISVDEIDKRRRASDTGPSPRASWCEPRRSAVRDPRASPSPTRLTPVTPGIPEEDGDEDESELFPLPSPKRTPRSSPASSPIGSLSSLKVPKRVNGPHSPSVSTCSGESHEPQASKQDLLTPPNSSSCSSLSLPQLGEPPVSPARAPSPSVLDTLPALSRRSQPSSPQALPTANLPPLPDKDLPLTPQSPEPASTPQFKKRPSTSSGIPQKATPAPAPVPVPALPPAVASLPNSKRPNTSSGVPQQFTPEPIPVPVQAPAPAPAQALALKSKRPNMSSGVPQKSAPEPALAPAPAPARAPKASKRPSTSSGIPQKLTSLPISPPTTRLPKRPTSSSGLSQKLSAPFSWRSKYASSQDVIPPVPPLPPLTSLPRTSKKSFSMPKPGELLSDVIRGVGAMGSTGMAPRM